MIMDFFRVKRLVGLSGFLLTFLAFTPMDWKISESCCSLPSEPLPGSNGGWDYDPVSVCLAGW